MRIKIISILFFLSICIKPYADVVDSLTQLANKSDEITKVKIYYKLSKYYLNSNADSALFYVLKSLELAEKNNLDTEIRIAYHQISFVYIATSDYDKADEASNKLIELSLKNEDRLNEANGYFNLGLSADYKGDFPNAHKNYHNALKIYEELKKYDGITKCYTNIGIVYYFEGLYEQATNYYKKALAMAEKYSIEDVKGNLLNNIANIYYQQEILDSALEYYFKSINQTLKDDHRNQDVAVMYGNIGLVYAELKDYKNSEKYHLKSLEIHENIGNKYGIATTYKDLGKLYLISEDYEKSIDFLNKSEVICLEIGAQQIREGVYKHLSASYSGLKDFEKAYNYYIKHVNLKDSIVSENNKKNILEIEAKYENSKKEKEILMLNQKQEQQKLIFYGVSLIIILLVIFSFIIFSKLKLTRKQKDIIENQKQIVEIKNTEITQSIEYAQKIQTALLPSEDIFKKHLPDSFIIFKPKDIVSGDFYWISDRDDYIFYATVDCTGHGVPGGFMSMLGTALLNEIIDERKIKNCGEVLNLMREKIIHDLRQSNKSESKDGMDMVLIRIDKKTLQMEYAAANNSFYIIRNNELLEQKCDKMPVGVYHSTVKPFQTFTHQLQKGDIIYTYTDGYADQFGGANNKKYTYKKLREKLLEINEKPLAEQKNILEKEFENWKGNQTQIDDVCLIGVKV